MENRIVNFGKLGAVVLLLTFCSGCNFLDYFKKKDTKKSALEVEKKEKTVAEAKTGEGAVLLTIDNKDVLYESDFNKHLAQMLKMNPYFRGAKPDSLPAQLKQKFFGELIKQEVIIAWANKNGLENDAEFIKSFEDMKKLLKRSLLVQSFEKKLLEKVKVSDSDVKDYFEKNKEKFVKEPASVDISGVKFSSKQKADDFYSSVKGKVSGFKAAAEKEYKNEYKDFGKVMREQKGFMPSDVPAKVKERAFSYSKTPVIDKVSAGKDTWVILVTDKTDSKYFTIGEIKPQLEDMLKENKFRQALEDRVKEISKEFTIDRNYDFFKEAAPAEQKTEDIPAKAA